MDQPNLEFNKGSDPQSKFEINLLIRDSAGNPTGKRKALSSDKAKDISGFYGRHQGGKRKNRGNKRTNSSNTPKKEK